MTISTFIKSEYGLRLDYIFDYWLYKLDEFDRTTADELIIQGATRIGKSTIGIILALRQMVRCVETTPRGIGKQTYTILLRAPDNSKSDFLLHEFNRMLRQSPSISERFKYSCSTLNTVVYRLSGNVKESDDIEFVITTRGAEHKNLVYQFLDNANTAHNVTSVVRRYNKGVGAIRTTSNDNPHLKCISVIAGSNEESSHVTSDIIADRKLLSDNSAYILDNVSRWAARDENTTTCFCIRLLPIPMIEFDYIEGEDVIHVPVQYLENFRHDMIKSLQSIAGIDTYELYTKAVKNRLENKPDISNLNSVELGSFRYTISVGSKGFNPLEIYTKKLKVYPYKHLLEVGVIADKELKVRDMLSKGGVLEDVTVDYRDEEDNIIETYNYGKLIIDKGSVSMQFDSSSSDLLLYTFNLVGV